MYRPKFCVECGEKVVRTRWYPWTSRRFCRYCVTGAAKVELLRAIGAVALLAGAGIWIGHSVRKPPPPLVMYSREPARPQGSPATTTSSVKESSVGSGLSLENAKALDVTYICGAKTKSGKPCTRRVRNGERCWQHKGAPAILSTDKLMVKK